MIMITEPGIKKKGKDWLTVDIVIAVLSLILISLAICYARERIIFSDTAVYMFDLVRTGHFVVPTNRFISILSQLLPHAGLGLGLSLQAIVVLYSVNLILIPIGSAMLVRYVFKQPGLALAILLFYIIMGSNLFYYPVSEFQMGLCLLLIYHGLLLTFKEGRVRSILYFPAGTLLLLFITFSHPMCLPVLMAWLAWIIITEPSVNYRDLLFPFCLILLFYFVKENYFKAMIGNEAFDDSRAEGLKNFGGTITSYFNGNLAQSSLKSIWGDHFIAVFFMLLSLIYLLWQRKWLIAMVYSGICFGFWLLVSVSFRDKGYNHYFEHLYQPLPFFISLAFVGYGIKLLGEKLIRNLFLGIAMILAMAKINTGHQHNAERQAWLQHYFGLMETLHLRKAAIGSIYTIGEKEEYWSAPCESILLSSLDQRDSSKTIFVASDFNNLQLEISQKEALVLGVKCWVPIETLDPKYFRLDMVKPYEVLDSFIVDDIWDSPADMK